jgi:uncharacterized membrane protein YbhN (UPF0104 family)
MFIKSIKYLVSLIVSIYLFNKISKEIYINLDQLQILTNRIYLVILILIIFIPIFYFLSVKLVYLVNNLKKVKLYDAYKTTVITYTYNLFLPAKSGDFFRHKYLNLKIKFTEFFNINLVEKLISLFVLLILVFLAYLFSDLEISKIINENRIYINLFFVLTCCLSLILIKLLTRNNKDLRLKIKQLFLFDILIWSLQFIQIFLIIMLLNIEITIFETIFVFGIAIIAGLIPISIGGFGVRDYVIFLLFSNLQIDGNLFMILLLFNFRYILPIIKSFFFSIFDLHNLKKLKF